MPNTVSEIFAKKMALDKQSGVNIKQLIKPNNTAPQMDTFQNNGMSKKKKLGIAAAIIAAAAVVTGIIIHKVNRAKALKEIPKELRAIFNELKGEEGENFVNKAYAKLKTYMKLDGIAPEKIGKSGAEKGTNAIGGFNPTLNTIEFSDGFFNKLKKADQFSLIGHELKHAEQTSKILRSGKINEYADAWAHSCVEQAKGNHENISFHKAWNASINNGTEKEFLDNMHTEVKQIVYDSMNTNHKESLNLTKFKPDSQEYKDAEKYIEATRIYTGLDSLGYRTPEYDANIIEKEAYTFSDKLFKHFKAFFGNK